MTGVTPWLAAEGERHRRVRQWELSLGGDFIQPTTRVAVASVGRFKTGKSTLLNCLLQVPLLPESATAETGLVTHVRVRDGTGTGAFTIHFRGEFEVSPDTPNASSLVREIRSRFDVEAVPAKRGDRFRFRRRPEAETRPVDGTLRNFLSSPIFQHVLDRVEIEMAGDEWSLPSFLELIDTPGLFSTRRHHQERAVEYMRSLGSEHLPVLLWLLPHRGEGESESATLADVLRHLPSLADRVVVLRNVDELELSSRTTEFGVETIAAAGAKLASYPVCLKRVAKNGPERSLVLDLIASAAGQELDALARAMDARVLAGVRREARQATLPPRRPGFRARVARAVEAREICVRIERHRDALHANHLKTLMLADARPVGDRCRKLGERIALNYNTAPYRSQREGAGTFVTAADELHRLLEGLVAKFVEAVDRQEAKDAGEALLAQVRRDTLRLPVIGAFSAGKTTLINALLGLDLPVAAGPATAVVTEISAGPSWEATTFYRAEIELPLIHCSRRGLDFESWRILTGDERSCGARTVASWMREGIAEDVRLLVPDLGRVARLEKRVLGEPVLRTMLAQRRLTQFKGGRDKVLATLDDMARQNSYTDEAKILRSKLPVRAVIRLRLPAGGPAPHGASVPVEDASTRARLYEHLRQPGVAPRVARVELRVPDRQLDHFTLVDTPGTDSVYVHHREATLDYARGCAAFLVVLNGKHPLSAEELELLDMLGEVARSRGATDVAKRFVFVATQRGRVAPSGRRDVEREYDILDRRFPGSLFFFVDSVDHEGEDGERFEGFKHVLGKRIRSFAATNLVLDAARQLQSLVMDEAKHQEGLRSLGTAEALEAEERRLTRGRDGLAALVERLESGDQVPFALPRQAGATASALAELVSALSTQISTVETPGDIELLRETIVAELEDAERSIRRDLRKLIQALHGELRAGYSKATGRDLAFGFAPLPDSPPIFSARVLVDALGGIDLSWHWWKAFWGRTEKRKREARNEILGALGEWYSDHLKVLASWTETHALAPQRLALRDVLPKVDEQLNALRTRASDANASLAQTDAVLARLRPLQKQTAEMVRQCESQ